NCFRDVIIRVQIAVDHSEGRRGTTVVLILIKNGCPGVRAGYKRGRRAQRKWLRTLRYSKSVYLDPIHTHRRVGGIHLLDIVNSVLLSLASGRRWICIAP